MKRIALTCLLSSIAFLGGSHIGSPGVSFEGKAGNYGVMVLVNPPDVIPGTATVDIYTQADGIKSIWAKPVYWYAGDEGTPQADQMNFVAGEPGHYKGIIWLMDAGTSGIEIEVHGDAGSGKVMVPVMAVSTVQRTMEPALGWILLGLCAFLVVLMITIISASVSDSLIKPNDTPAPNLKRKRWAGILVSSLILVTLLSGGKIWWDSWANDYRRFMFKSFNATTTVVREGNQHKLIFKVDTARLTNLSFTRNLSYIIPDHGKLMHMFLVRAESMDVFAHLHPKRKDSVTFVTSLPPLPSGKYLVFADITRLSGFSETIPDTLEIAQEKLPTRFTSADTAQLHAEDTYFMTNAISQNNPTQTPDDIILCGKPGIRTPLKDGSTITWEHDSSKPLLSTTLYSLKFNVLDESGQAAVLEPYLGMAGHAVVMKEDGSVYIHLHPVGSYSMASQQTMLNRFENEIGPVNFDKLPKAKIFMDSVDSVIEGLEAMTEEERNKVLMKNMNHDQFDAEHPEHSLISFPYAFPSPGRYRIWIQIKRKGKILNSAFDADVR
jgi:hypothetical protein